MRPWVWRDFRVDLPDDWEMLQFSRDAGVGRCAFADRYRFRLEFSWRSGLKPGLERMMSDYLARLKEEGSEDAAPCDLGAWRGIRGRSRDVLVTRFGRFFDGESCLIEVVLVWPDGHDDALERGILESVRGEPDVLGRFRRWVAFGMDLLASRDLALDGCGVDPAYARMAFSTPSGGLWSALSLTTPAAGGRREERFERLGMVRQWLKGTVRAWLSRRVPPGSSVEAESSDEVSGHRVETVRTAVFRNGLARLLGRPDRCEAAAWICPADGRLYFVKMTGRPPRGGRLSGIDVVQGGADKSPSAPSISTRTCGLIEDRTSGAGWGHERDESPSSRDAPDARKCDEAPRRAGSKSTPLPDAGRLRTCGSEMLARSKQLLTAGAQEPPLAGGRLSCCGDLVSGR